MKKMFVSIAAVAAMVLMTACGFDLNSDAMIDTADQATATDNAQPTDNEVVDDTVTDDTVTDETAPDADIASDTETDIDTTDESPDSDFDNGFPTASLSGPAGIEEGTSGTIKVTLDKTAETATVFYVFFNPEDDDTAVCGTDYTVTMTDNCLVIPAGAKEASFSLNNLENSDTDGNRTVTAYLYCDSNGINLGNSQIVILLYDNDVVDTGTFAFFSTSAEVAEGGTVCADIIRTGNTFLPASIVLRKTSGNISDDITILPAGTYDSVSGQVLNYGANETSKSICFTAVLDSLAEGDETSEFRIELPSAYSKIDSSRNLYSLIIKDTAYETKEIVGDRGAELMCTFEKNYDKCYAASTNFTIQKEFVYRILSYTFYCDDMVVGDAIHCQTVGTDYSTDIACELPQGGVGYTGNADGC